MKKVLMGLWMCCAVLVLVSCDDSLFKPVDPHLEGVVTPIGYELTVTNQEDVRNSHGGAALVCYVWSLYYAEGEYTEVPTENVKTQLFVPCPFTGNQRYIGYKPSGKYTFWIIGTEASDENDKTGPSNLVVLEFP